MKLHKNKQMSQSNCSPATAFPVGDAPYALSAAGVENMQAGSVNIRKLLSVACWNVRTFLDTGSQAITIRALHDYGVDIACLSEVRLPGSGSRHIKVPGNDSHYWLYHSGPEDGSGQHGVALVLSAKTNKALISWTPVSSRIATARFRGQPFNVTVIAVYAPTLAADPGDKDEFYENLQAVVNQVPKRDILIVAGDWNAKTGPSDNSTRHILGRFGLGERCENGSRLINFAAYNRMCVSNTRFQHPKKHLLTWYSNDGKTANQIDYILVRSRWMSSVIDSRSYRGAEAGNNGGSDHTLVRAKLKLRLKARQRRLPTKRLDTAPLKDTACCNALSMTINQKLEAVDNSITWSAVLPVDSQWRHLKTCIQEAAINQLGTTSRRQRDWITEQTIHMSALAKEARLSNSPDYRRLRREATRNARIDRKRYWTDMACNMESAANVGDFGKLYRLIRNASGRRQPDNSLRSATGELISDLDGKIARWKEHFSELLNRPLGRLSEIAPSEPSSVYNVNCAPPTEAEISAIIRQLKNRKSPGEDGVPAEIYKACLSALLTPLHNLFCSIWEQEVFPADWGTTILLPFPKKGTNPFARIIGVSASWT